MGAYLDSVPMSGIIRIRDMMYGVSNPFRLDQGDVSYDAPAAVKEGMARAIAENRSHYLQTAGVPRLQELVVGKLREVNRIPVATPDEVLVTNGGIHGLYLTWQALLEPGDEVLIPDPEWPPAAGTIQSAHGVVVRYRLHERGGWRFDLDELAALITSRTRAIYLNSPNNPTGGVLTRGDLEGVVTLAADRGLWIVSDEAYEDVVFEGEHVSVASLAGLHERIVSVFTFSKTFAMTGIRLGYVVASDATLRDRLRKVLFFTTSNVCSVAQYGGIAGLEAPRTVIDGFRAELLARRDLFYQGIDTLGGVLSGEPPRGAFYGFLRIAPDWTCRALAPIDEGGEAQRPGADGSLSWSLASYLIRHGRIGCVPGVDFGPSGEGYIRFCFAREREELAGALASMRSLFRS